MTIAEGSSTRVSYKFYASGVMVANTKATSSSDLGASSAQILRRTTCDMSLKKDTYESNENRSDQQIGDFRHGVGRAQGKVSGEFSPATYWDFFEASLRGTDEASVTASQSDFTSLAADNSTSKFVAAAGAPVTKGLRVGHILRGTTLSDADNNAKNFLITGFSGTSNRNIAVYPAPDTMTADTSFSLATAGRRLYMPSSGFVSRKVGIERYSSDVDIAQLFTECRIGGFNINLPATGMSTLDFELMGRDMEPTSGGSAPFFTSPTAETTTGIFAAVNGLLMVAGAVVGIVTGISIQGARTLTGPAVVGQNFPPDILIGPLKVTGQITALFTDATLINYFKNETELEVLLYLTTTSAVNSPAASIYLPRVKLGGADLADPRDGEMPITMPFTALKSTAVEASTGIASTTIQFCDTEAS
jgi:hypothetical protein